MTAHPHAENMRLYAEDATETDRPWERWECRKRGEVHRQGGRWVHAWEHCQPDMRSWRPDYEYRRKPRTIRIRRLASNG